MSAMQVFHLQLHPKLTAIRNPYLNALVQLTQASLDQLKALEGAPAWDPWEASAS